MNPGKTSQLFEMVQDVTNHVLTLVQQMGEMSGKIEVLNGNLNIVKDKQAELDSKLRQIRLLLPTKMDPERCMHFHHDMKDQLEKQVKESIRDTCTLIHKDLKDEIYDEMREGARGWGRVAMKVLKVTAWVSITFGMSSWGLKALGVFAKLGL